jgi:hypothetical protein
MTDQVRVVDSEPAERLPSTTPRSGWVLFALGFAVGVGAAVVFVTPTGSSPTATTTPGVVAPPITTEDPEPEVGVSEVVEGFPDAVVAVSRTAGSSLNHLLWPFAGGLNLSPMAGGDTAVFDSSGRFVALTSEVPGVDGVVLSMGRHNQIRHVAAGVTSHAWHDSQSGVLAYTTVSDGMWRLSTVTSNFQPEVVLESDADMGRVVAWGDWGWAIQSDPSQLTLLTPAGELKDTEPGTALASHHTGWLFVHDGVPKLVSAGGGVVTLQTDPGVGVPIGAAFSPDGSKLAVAGPRGVSILYLETGAAEAVDVFSSPAMSWSSDSRFLLSASGSGVVVLDDEENIVQTILRRHSMLAVAVIPLTGPG